MPRPTLPVLLRQGTSDGLHTFPVRRCRLLSWRQQSGFEHSRLLRLRVPYLRIYFRLLRLLHQHCRHTLPVCWSIRTVHEQSFVRLLFQKSLYVQIFPVPMRLYIERVHRKLTLQLCLRPSVLVSVLSGYGFRWFPGLSIEVRSQ